MKQNKTSGFPDKMEVIFGVPRGSVFRQVLFQIYVNNFSPYISDCLVIQYAEDKQFIHPGTIGNIEQLGLKSEETLQRKKKKEEKRPTSQQQQQQQKGRLHVCWQPKLYLCYSTEH